MHRPFRLRLAAGLVALTLLAGQPAVLCALACLTLHSAPRAEHQARELGSAARIPITGPEADEQDVLIVFRLIRHFPLPR
ncbi:MAG: hypothetical protein GTN62_09775 [Gemmatimonadales bacterium]|nr:hypothetical protein [Gemmatimonadales bacterium]NIN11833.1 hypothetical protein [Gemmatimonadales bacterium]NIN50383.1 hypothetical protein [Gemmatimonadales bacterium]NIP07847.1 hypothetical protein [Gemmatimonadales bacterium]NIR02052.1 hypothetical protein [Gemmatimonadales bacterium]